MDEGVYANVEVDCQCGLAAVSDSARAPVSDVTRTVVPDDSGDVTVEFQLTDRHDVDELPVDATTVFENGEATVYRLFQRCQATCAYARVERQGCPVDDFEARHGAICLGFHAADLDRVKAVVGALREAFANVRLRRLSGTHDSTVDDFVQVDRTAFTDRQREVFETAYDLGYFEYPRGANARDVADELGISTTTLAEHMATIQSKLAEQVLDGWSAD
jgi:hypothetical protein